jgi:ParB family chromosome partitioning protein
MASVSGLAKASGGGHTFDGFDFAVSAIRIKDGFNYRNLETPEARAKIRAMADAMKNPDVGYRRKFPLVIQRIDDEVYLIDGHRRFTALQLANSEGAGIEMVPVIHEPQGTDDLDRDYDLFLTGEPLEVLEKATGVKRLRNRNQSFDMIAARLGVTVQTIKGWLELAGAPDELVQVVDQDKLAATEAHKLFKANGSAGSVRLAKAAIEHAEARGKTKATGQDIKAVTERPEPDRTVRESIHTIAARLIVAARENALEHRTTEELDAAVEAMAGIVGEAAVGAARVKRKEAA